MTGTAKLSPVAARAECCRILSGGRAASAAVQREDFWETAWKEGVGACIWHALDATDADMPQVLRQVCIEGPLRAQTVHALRFRQLATTILRRMRTAGIACLILRGQALAEGLYRPPASRPQTDIDLLVHESEVSAATDVMRKAGFGAVEHHPLLFVREGVLLDLHADPLDMERIHAWAYLTPLRTRDFFTHAEHGELAGVPCLLVHPRVNLPYLCFHAMKHSFERLVWLWDIALLARQVQEQCQWDEVLKGIREYRLERPCFYALSYVREHLGASVPVDMLEEIQPAMNWRERALYSRFMHHETIPFLAERLFARMMPDFSHRMAFWRETIYPREEVRRQIAGEGCVHCYFLRKRMRQLLKAGWMMMREMWVLLRRVFVKNPN